MLTTKVRSFLVHWPAAVPALLITFLAVVAPPLTRELLLTGALAMVTINGIYRERRLVVASGR